MAYSYRSVAGDGVTAIFGFTFGYLDVSHIHVYVDGVEQDFTWNNSQAIQLASPPAGGAIVMIRRETPRDARLVDFENGSMLTEGNLDKDANQAFYVMQEAFDSLLGLITTDDADGKLDAENKTIKNVAGIEGAFKATFDAIQAACESARNAAQLAQTNAETAETNAETAEAHAVTARTNAETAETNAETAETNAVAAKVKAQKWAEEAEDVPVETGLYSAKHWAVKAGDIVSGDHNHDDRYFTETEADARYQQDVAQAWDAVQRSTATALSIVTGAIDWNLATASGYGKVTLTENVTINLPSNLVDGAVFFMRLIQDSTGGRTVSYNASILFGSEDAPVMPTTLSTGELILGFTTNGTKVECWEVWRSE